MMVMNKVSMSVGVTAMKHMKVMTNNVKKTRENKRYLSLDEDIPPLSAHFG